jgi:serine/threonine protein kinase
MNLSYKHTADMWSVGLIAMELLSGCDWYHGKRPVKEKKAPFLRWIESLVGLITEDAWKGVSQSASWQEYRRTWPCDPLATATPFTTPARPLPVDGEQLASSMLRLVPEERISAAATLRHPYFSDAISEVHPPLVLKGLQAIEPAVAQERLESGAAGGGSEHADAKGGRMSGL